MSALLSGSDSVRDLATELLNAQSHQRKKHCRHRAFGKVGRQQVEGNNATVRSVNGGKGAEEECRSSVHPDSRHASKILKGVISKYRPTRCD